MNVELNTARDIIAGTRAAARTARLKPLAVVILDAGGHLVAAEREDGASFNRIEIAHGKAHGSLAMGVSSRDLMTRAEQQPYFIAAATTAIGGALIPVPGGVFIRDSKGTVLGAIGVSGDTSDNDEAAAIEGIKAAGMDVLQDG